jgi:hypothetical protein
MTEGSGSGARSVPLTNGSAILSRSLILGLTTEDFSESDGSVLKIQWAF